MKAEIDCHLFEGEWILKAENRQDVGAYCVVRTRTYKYDNTIIQIYSYAKNCDCDPVRRNGASTHFTFVSHHCVRFLRLQFAAHTKTHGRTAPYIYDNLIATYLSSVKQLCISFFFLLFFFIFYFFSLSLNLTKGRAVFSAISISISSSFFPFLSFFIHFVALANDYTIPVTDTVSLFPRSIPSISSFQFFYVIFIFVQTACIF